MKKILFLILAPLAFINAEVGILKTQESREYFENLEEYNSHSSQYKSSDSYLYQNSTNIIENSFFSLNLFNPLIYLSYNSNFPKGINDGALWQGKGFNTQVETGIIFQSKYLDISLSPKVWWSENSDITIVDSKISNEYGAMISGMDWYQRPGEQSYYEIDPGKSFIRGKVGVFSLELSTANFILGPARISPIMMSDNSAGLPHIRLGMNDLKTLIGVFEYNAFVGYLNESDFFDDVETNDNRLITAYNFAYSPSIIDGLTLGFNRSLIAPEEYISAAVVFKIFDPYINGGGTIGEGFGYDQTDQRMSLTYDWSFPNSGLNIYGELAKNDYSSDYTTYIRTPEHTIAFSTGLGKRFNNFLLEVEYSDLIESRDYKLGGLGGGGTFYKHHIVTQGYTQKGQLLGAGIGSGSDAQTLSLSYFGKDFSVKSELQRVAFVKDYVYGNHYDSDDGLATYPVDRIWADITAGLSGSYDLNGLSIYVELAITKSFSHNFIPGDDPINIYGALGFTYDF